MFDGQPRGVHPEQEVPTISHPTGRENYTEVTVNGTTYYFSYKTCIAFHSWDSGAGVVVCQNVWSTTTGKHLNYIDGGSTDAKNLRVDLETFQNQLSQTGDLTQYLETNLDGSRV